MLFKLNSFDLISFLIHFRVLLDHDRTAAQAIELIANQTSHPRFRAYLLTVHRDLNAGMSLAQALFNKRHPFPNSMTRCLQQMPHNDHELSRTIKALEDNYRIHTAVTLNITSPRVDKIIILAKLLGPSLFVLGLAPLFNRYYQGIEKLPLPTQLTVNVYNYFIQTFPISLMTMIAIAYVITLFIHHNKLFNYHMVYFFSLIDSQIKSHAHLLQALTWAIQSIDDKLIIHRLRPIVEHIKNGQTLAEAIQTRKGTFPRFIFDLVDFGEKKDDLSAAFKEIIDYYTHQSTIDIKKWHIRLSTFALMNIGGGLIAFYLPIFKMAGGFR